MARGSRRRRSLLRDTGGRGSLRAGPGLEQGCLLKVSSLPSPCPGTCSAASPMSPAQLLFDTAIHLPPHRPVTRKTNYQALGEAASGTKGQQQRPQQSAEESKATQILSHQAKTGTRVCFLWRKQGLGHGSGFGPGSAVPHPLCFLETAQKKAIRGP